MTAEEAEERMSRFGPNELAEAKPTSFLAILWEQLNNFVVILLIVASVISALLGEWVDASAILAIVVLNAVLGIVQERRAEAGAGRPEAPGRAGGARPARRAPAP